MGSFNIKSGGAWRTSKSINVKVGGTWRAAKEVWVKSGGVWRKAWSSFSATISPSALYASAVATNFRPATAQRAATVTPVGGTAPFTYAYEISPETDALPFVAINGQTMTLRLSSSSTVEASGQIRGKVTDAQGEVGFTPWAYYSLSVEGTEGGGPIEV